MCNPNIAEENREAGAPGVRRTVQDRASGLMSGGKIWDGGSRSVGFSFIFHVIEDSMPYRLIVRSERPTQWLMKYHTVSFESLINGEGVAPPCSSSPIGVARWVRA